MIEKMQLPETDLIVRDEWPEYDEDAYQREADKLHATAERAGESAVVAMNSQSYTAEEYHGLSGEAMSELMIRRRKEFIASQERHNSVGGLMENASRNIIDAKNNINEAQLTYHEKFSEATAKAAQEGWTQHHLNDVKRELVTEGQTKVTTTYSSFMTNHNEIVANISGAVHT